MPYVFSDISRAIRGERRARGVSQAALAARLGLRQGTVSRAEQGADIHLNTLMQIARALVEVEDTFSDFPMDEENEP